MIVISVLNQWIILILRYKEVIHAMKFSLRNTLQMETIYGHNQFLMNEIV